jgi:arsenite-transporting ATPase
VRNQHLVINGVFQANDSTDPVAAAMEQRARSALARIPNGLATLPRTLVPLASHGLLGIDALRAIANAASLQVPLPKVDPIPDLPPLVQLIDDLERNGRGVILTMGKGGVGKTTIAAAIALALADRGHPVHLSTTDPAAHLADTLTGNMPLLLTISRIDPKAETEAYSAEVMATAGKDLDVQGRALLAEDLRSPCTEEIAVFRAFAAAVAQGDHGFVVLDTAPTGHTILLLDSALAYHREVTRQASGMPESVEKLLPRLRDVNYTHVLIVTLPEATPVHEAAKLQEDLNRAGIAPYGWVINQSLTPLAVTDSLLCSRQIREATHIREVVERLAARSFVIPWQTNPPVGAPALRDLVNQSGVAAADMK